MIFVVSCQYFVCFIWVILKQHNVFFYATTVSNYILFTTDVFIVEYCRLYRTNNTVNKCCLFFSVNIMEIFKIKNFGVIIIIFVSSSALKVIDVKFV